MLNLAKKKKVELTGSQNHRKEESTLALKLTGYIDSSFTRALSLSPSVFPSHFYFCILATFKWELQPLLALEPTLTASMPKTKTDLLFLLQLEQFGVRKGLMWMHSMSMYSFPGSASGKEPAHQGRRRRRCGFGPGSGRSPRGGNGNPLQYFLPGESHGQRSLADYSLWCHRVEHNCVIEHARTCLGTNH